jgi:glutamate 5-kinase
MENYWEKIKDKKRIVIKVGSSTLTCKETGNLNYSKLEKLVRAISDLKNSGKQVILVSSGAVAVGRETLKIGRRPKTMAEKQACAAIGQGKLIMNYYKLFAEYGLVASQVLMTRYSLDHEKSYNNLKNTFQELLNYGAIPIVNENDAIATDEIEFGENDTLSSIVTAITESNLLILLTDTDGLYTDDPFQNKDAKLIDIVTSEINDIQKVAKKSSDSDVGTGGMYTKVLAGKIVNPLGIDMIIANGKNPNILNKIVSGEKHGTLFVGRKTAEDNIRQYLLSKMEK